MHPAKVLDNAKKNREDKQRKKRTSPRNEFVRVREFAFGLATCLVVIYAGAVFVLMVYNVLNPRLSSFFLIFHNDELSMIAFAISIHIVLFIQNHYATDYPDHAANPERRARATAFQMNSHQSPYIARSTWTDIMHGPN